MKKIALFLIILFPLSSFAVTWPHTNGWPMVHDEGWPEWVKQRKVDADNKKKTDKILLCASIRNQFNDSMIALDKEWDKSGPSFPSKEQAIIAQNIALQGINAECVEYYFIFNKLRELINLLPQ